MERQFVDVDALVSDLDAEFSDTTEVTEDPVPQGDETVDETTEVADEPTIEAESTEETSEDTAEEPEAPAPEPEQPPAQVNDPDVHKRNEAFKKLREENQRLAESDAMVAKLATQYGMTKEALIAKFREDQIAKDAKAQGVPVEQFKRMQELESQVKTLNERYQKERFNVEAERLVQKYSLSPKEANEVFAKIGAMGIDVLGNPQLLEVAFKAVDYDKAVSKGRQAQLSETKKRRETAPSPTLGTKGGNVDTTLADMDSDIDAFLKAQGIIK